MNEPHAELTKDDRLWGMICHLSTFCAYIGIPFGNIIAPLIIWSLKKDQSQFVDYNGKEALNFQISITIYALFAVVLVFFFIGIPILLAIGAADVVFTIIAALKANNGEYYRYPMTIRFIK